MPLSQLPSRIERYRGLPVQDHLRQVDADLDIQDIGMREIKDTLDGLKARANGILASLVVAALLLAANLAIGIK